MRSLTMHEVLHEVVCYAHEHDTWAEEIPHSVGREERDFSARSGCAILVFINLLKVLHLGYPKTSKLSSPSCAGTAPVVPRSLNPSQTGVAKGNQLSGHCGQASINALMSPLAAIIMLTDSFNCKSRRECGGHLFILIIPLSLAKIHDSSYKHLLNLPHGSDFFRDCFCCRFPPM